MPSTMIYNGLAYHRTLSNRSKVSESRHGQCLPATKVTCQTRVQNSPGPSDEGVPQSAMLWRMRNVHVMNTCLVLMAVATEGRVISSINLPTQQHWQLQQVNCEDRQALQAVQQLSAKLDRCSRPHLKILFQSNDSTAWCESQEHCPVSTRLVFSYLFLP